MSCDAAKRSCVNVDPETGNTWIAEEGRWVNYELPLEAVIHGRRIKENVIVVGGGDIAGKKLEKFINVGLKAVKENIENDPDAETTLLLLDIYLTQEDKEEIQRVLADIGGNQQLIPISSTDEITNYLNSKDVKKSEFSIPREQTRVHDVWLIGHGHASSFDPTYCGLVCEQQNTTMGSWDIEDVQKLDPRAFESPNWRFETCNAATKPRGKTTDLVEEVTQRTKGAGYGYKGRSDFEGIMSRFSRTFTKRRIAPADYYPTPGENALRVFYSKGTVTNMEWK